MLLIGFCASGCKKKQSDEAKPAAKIEPTKEAVEKVPPMPSERPEGPTGNLEGKVTFIGSVPEMPKIQSGSDPECAKFTHFAETVLVNPDKTLRDVVVRIAPGSVRDGDQQKKFMSTRPSACTGPGCRQRL